MILRTYVKSSSLLLLICNILSGCGDKANNQENAVKVNTPEVMIHDLTRLAEGKGAWDVLSARGIQVVKSVDSLTNAQERVRLLEMLEQAMRSFKEPSAGNSPRLHRIWALQCICHEMRRAWWDLDRPEKVVDDWMYVLEKYGEEYKRMAPADFGRKDNAGTPSRKVSGQGKYSEYEKVEAGMLAFAKSFELHVLPRARLRIPEADLNRVEEQFRKIMGRAPLKVD